MTTQKLPLTEKFPIISGMEAFVFPITQKTESSADCRVVARRRLTVHTRILFDKLVQLIFTEEGSKDFRAGRLIKKSIFAYRASSRVSKDTCLYICEVAGKSQVQIRELPPGKSDSATVVNLENLVSQPVNLSDGNKEGPQILWVPVEYGRSLDLTFPIPYTMKEAFPWFKGSLEAIHRNQDLRSLVVLPKIQQVFVMYLDGSVLFID